MILLGLRESALLCQGLLFEPKASSAPGTMILADSRSLSSIRRRSPARTDVTSPAYVRSTIPAYAPSMHRKRRPPQTETAAGKKHPFYRRGRIHVQELNNQKFAVREYGSGTRQLFEDYTLRHDLRIRTAWEANSPRALLNAVLYNQMLSVMSIRLMHHEIRHRSVRVFCNEAGEWNRKFKLVYHKNKFLTPAIFELEKILHTYQQLELPSVMGVLEQE